MAAGETSFTALKGTMQSSKTALTPFFADSDGTFWTSDMARTTEAFGYAYADTITKHESDQDLRDELIQKINAWYGPSSPVGLMAGERDTTPSDIAAEGLETADDEQSRLRPNIRYDAKDPPAAQIVKRDHYTEWIASVSVNVEALDGSFVVHFFLGPPPDDSINWHLAPNLIGTVAVFAMNRMTGSQSKISGAVPLTWAVMKMVAAGEIDDLSPRVVQPFLAEVLHFAVQSSNNSRVDPSLVDGLHISVTSASVRIPKNEFELPVWGSAVGRLKLWP